MSNKYRLFPRPTQDFIYVYFVALQKKYVDLFCRRMSGKQQF